MALKSSLRRGAGRRAAQMAARGVTPRHEVRDATAGAVLRAQRGRASRVCP
jgi:hypothetical protein